MTTPVYTSPFTGTVVTPTDVSYSSLTFSTNTPLFWPAIVNQGTGQTPATRIIDCNATTTGLSISLPEADQGTLGADILFRNLGSNAFTVTDFAGGETVTIAAGIAQYFYLTNNTTQATINSGGKFGIGIAPDPTIKFYVSDTHNNSLGSSSFYISTTQNQATASGANDNGIYSTYSVNGYNTASVQNQALFKIGRAHV